jgi:phosphoglycerate-specific signal transduction histidine kinase
MQEYWAWQDEQRRSAAKARTEAAMTKRKEQRLAQQAKLAAVGVTIPTAQEVRLAVTGLKPYLNFGIGPEMMVRFVCRTSLKLL